LRVTTVNKRTCVCVRECVCVSSATLWTGELNMNKTFYVCLLTALYCPTSGEEGINFYFLVGGVTVQR